MGKPALRVIIVIVAGMVLVAVSAEYILNKDQVAPAASVQTSETRQTGYENITSQELSNMLAAKNFIMINVHIPYEGEIARTDAFIPYDRIDKDLDKLPIDKNSKIVLYCQSGRMSKVAAEKLASIGYTNLFNLSGGMIEWEKQGFQLIRK